MPRVHTQKAAKDYPEHGIKKGDTYYKWSFRYGGTHMSKTPPKQSQLTQSKMSAAYAASESLDEGLVGCASPDDIVSLLDEAIDEIQTVAGEYRDAAQAEPRPPSADEWEEKADELDSWISDLSDVRDEIGTLSSSDIVEILDLEEAPKDEDGNPKFNLESVEFDDLDDDQQSQILEHLYSRVSDVSGCPI